VSGEAKKYCHAARPDRLDVIDVAVIAPPGKVELGEVGYVGVAVVIDRLNLTHSGHRPLGMPAHPGKAQIDIQRIEDLGLFGRE
jgi:hypothetical protein